MNKIIIIVAYYQGVIECSLTCLNHQLNVKKKKNLFIQTTNKCENGSFIQKLISIFKENKYEIYKKISCLLN